MLRINRLLHSRRLFLVNLTLVSLLVGSFLGSAVNFGCNSTPHVVFAKSANNMVHSDSEALSSAQLTQRAFRNIAKSLGPAVVSINATRLVAYRNPYSDMFDDEFFRHFFGRRRRSPRNRKRKAPALGSGFVIDKKGYLLTNYHVVRQANEIKVIFPDGREYKARLVGTDRETDIALLKIDPKGDIPVVTLGDSDKLQVGDWAIAIGNPFGLPGTFTVGVVSSRSRGDKVGLPYQNFIQTDTAINPGNSGGPLVNIEGEVVGINTMIYTRSGGNLGIGFSIPINIAKDVVKSLLKKGYYERGYLGIRPAPVKEKMRKALKLKNKQGVLVNSVLDDTPASRAGMKDGDVILKINGRDIESVPQLMRYVASLPVGKTVEVVVLRNWKRVTLRLKIGKRPTEEKISRNQEKPDSTQWLGLRTVTVSSLSDLQRRRFRIAGNARGVVIMDIKGAAEDAGFQTGDLITAINYVPIQNMGDYKQFIQRQGNKNNFIFKVQRQGRTFFIAVNK